MLFKGKRKYFIILAIIFTIVYLFVATEPIKQGVYFKPLWICSIDDADVESSKDLSEAKNPLPFVMGNRFGYFSKNGKILKSKSFDEKISISSQFWTTYPKRAEKTNIYSFKSLDKEAVFAVNEAGYVHIDSDRVYLFEPDGCAVSKFDNTGKKLWRYIHAAPITAFQSSPNGTIIGYSDGKLVCLSNAGEVLFDFYPGGSNYQVITGVAISEDASKALCVCGLENQRMLLISIEDNHHKIIHHTFFSKDLRRQTFVSFDESGDYAVFESADGIGIIDCNSFETFFVKEDAKLIDIGKKMENGVLTILVQKDFVNTLFAISPPNGIIGKTSFEAKNTFLIQDEDRVYLGSDSKILGLKMDFKIGD